MVTIDESGLIRCLSRVEDPTPKSNFLHQFLDRKFKSILNMLLWPRKRRSITTMFCEKNIPNSDHNYYCSLKNGTANYLKDNTELSIQNQSNQ